MMGELFDHYEHGNVPVDKVLGNLFSITFVSECGMIVHSKCKSKLAQFCGTRQVAAQMYEEWKEQVGFTELFSERKLCI